MNKGCEMRPPAYRPYPKRLESLIIADVVTKAALSAQLFKDPECWSGRSGTHDLPRDSPVLNQLSHRCAVQALQMYGLHSDSTSSIK